MSKQQVTRLSKVKRLIVNNQNSNSLAVLLIDGEQYKDLKSQLEKPFKENGLKRLIFDDGEVASINENTVVIVDDIR